MNDRLPGSSYSNPIWHGHWRIFSELHYMHDIPGYAYVHDDYDGAEDAHDNRFGWANTIDQAKADIDEFESENAK